MAAPRSMGGLAALAVVLALGIVLGRTQRIEGPSRSELAQALSQDGARIGASALRDLDCDVASGVYDCRWEQQIDDRWHERSGRIALSSAGWRMR